MEKNIKNKIKNAFYDYPKLKRHGAASVVEWAESGMAVDYSKIKVQSSNMVGKETYLCSLLDENFQSYRWAIVVEKVLDFYKWGFKERFIQLRYFERKTTVQICFALPISERTFRYWEEEILLKAYMWAKELNLI